MTTQPTIPPVWPTDEMVERVALVIANAQDGNLEERLFWEDLTESGKTEMTRCARAALEVMRPMIVGAEAAALERAAVKADKYETGIVFPKARMKFADEETKQTVRDEQRGERIAAKKISEAIRALKSTTGRVG